jgi:hypothetical protein
MLWKFIFLGFAALCVHAVAVNVVIFSTGIVP